MDKANRKGANLQKFGLPLVYIANKNIGYDDNNKH